MRATHVDDHSSPTSHCCDGYERPSYPPIFSESQHLFIGDGGNRSSATVQLSSGVKKQGSPTIFNIRNQSGAEVMSVIRTSKILAVIGLFT